MANEVGKRPQAPPPGLLQQNKSVIDECNDYLISRNWKCLAKDEGGLSTWEDPKGAVPQKSVKTLIRQLPTRMGGEEPLRQAIIPPVAWIYPLGEAVAIQRMRDLEETRQEDRKRTEEEKKRLQKAGAA